MEFKDRLKESRLKEKLSQGKLAEIVGIHVTNVSRYERGEHKPSTQILSKIANALNVTTDYLMSGSLNEQAVSMISDKELLSQFQRLEKLPNNKKDVIKEVIEAFLFKTNVQQQLAS